MRGLILYATLWRERETGYLRGINLTNLPLEFRERVDVAIDALLEEGHDEADMLRRRCLWAHHGECYCGYGENIRLCQNEGRFNAVITYVSICLTENKKPNQAYIDEILGKSSE